MRAFLFLLSRFLLSLSFNTSKSLDPRSALLSCLFPWFSQFDTPVSLVKNPAAIFKLWFSQVALSQHGTSALHQPFSLGKGRFRIHHSLLFCLVIGKKESFGHTLAWKRAFAMWGCWLWPVVLPGETISFGWGWKVDGGSPFSWTPLPRVEFLSLKWYSEKGSWN